MSTQPYAPAGFTPAAVTPQGPKRNRVLIVLGAVALAAGVAGGVILLLKSSSSVEDRVASFARAPSGCTTSLRFDSTGTFEVYVERTGRITGLAGGCKANGSSYDRRGTGLPGEKLTLVDDGDRQVPIDDADASTYDAGGFRGTRVGTVTIDNKGEYRLTVVPDDPGDDNYAIAIGKDAKADQATLRNAGIASLGAGVVLGGLLLLLGLRRSASPAPPTAAGTGSWSPGPPPAPVATWPPQAPAATPNLPPTLPAAAPPQQPSVWAPAPPTPQQPGPVDAVDEPTRVYPPASPFAPPRPPDAG